MSRSPHAAAGGPDASGMKAFIATGKQGVTYRPDTWHHGLTVLDRPGRFAVFMWRDGGKGDDENERNAVQAARAKAKERIHRNPASSE